MEVETWIKRNENVGKIQATEIEFLTSVKGRNRLLKIKN
jgi:hypothetical protein